MIYEVTSSAKIAKRFVDQNSYPWINFWLRLAGNALARHKEEYIFDFITRIGTVVFNNDPAARRRAKPAVQRIDGGAIGSNYKEDLKVRRAKTSCSTRTLRCCWDGFVPDTMLVQPMTRLVWVKDPVLRD